MTLVFYDGICALCNGAVTFLLKRDRAGVFRFAPLQGELAAQLLPKYGIDPSELDSIVVVADWNTPGERPLTRSTGALHALALVEGVWGTFARAAQLIPASVRDLVYGAVARTRYRTFGRYDVCPIPPPEWRNRFLK